METATTVPPRPQAAMRSAASVSGKIGASFTPVASSMEPPTRPISAARVMARAASAGASPKPFSRSADTGRSVESQISFALASDSCRVMP
jgi:hypothetical protein